ncbi:hypothetical protein APHAL10511_007622 [Amanita phalloides]|nr:hypothetical protein APHAL10511_007622 [Amanita phalloides]
MDDKRASTLEALESFIQTQRSLLEQTQQDIVKLRKLKSYVLSRSSVDPQDLLHQLDEIGEVKDPEHYRLVIPKEIDWGAFNGCDPAPLHALTLATQEKLSLGSKPASTQQSPLSDLQILVRESKKTIIDPVLDKCAAYAAQLSIDDGDDADGEDGKAIGRTDHGTVETERERERKKIRELKKRKLHAGLSLPGMGIGAAGVFVRKDVRDESAIVDVTAAETEGGSPTRRAFRNEEGGADARLFLHLDDGYGHLPPPPIETDVARVKSRPARTRKATARRRLWQEEEESNTSKKRKRRAGSTPTPASTSGAARAVFEPSLAQDPGSPMDIELGVSEDDEARVAHTTTTTTTTTTNGGTSARGRGLSHPNLTKTDAKSKSETYKQSWTESEQNLLEQLLEKIPDGEKNRWQKISQAMNGRRTPRQVASRVQKYFEKLKKYGIDVK